MDPLKLTEQIAADLKARVKTLDFKTVEKIRKAKDENGTFDVIISTEDIDRAGEIVRQDGWDLANYKNNPIVLWGHDYYSLPIGICIETYRTEVRGLPALGARGVFYPADINPFAQQVRRMHDFGMKNGVGVGCTTSVGFIPKEFDMEADRPVITKAELLEFSFVPIPANQGVGPAQGRAFTFDEAKELGLDVPALTTKGMQFVEPEKPVEKKEAKASDTCTMDDGTPGEYVDDGEGNLVCQPIADKSIETKPLQKKLLSAVGDEHTRHIGEIEKAVDAFETALADDDSEQDAEKKAQKAAERVRAGMKDLRDAVRDEHDMHRAKSIAAFRGFEPAEDKAFDRKPHLKTLRDAHEAYEGGTGNLLNQLEERCLTATEYDDHIDWFAEQMEGSERAHKKAVLKAAKAMCNAAFGEEEQADETVLAILKEFLAPHIDAQLLPAVAAKVGARISSATREKLAACHSHMQAATAIVAALHGGLGNDDGEEGGSDGDGKSAPSPAPRKQRSRPSEGAGNDELNAHLFARDLMREITTVAQRGLEKLNKAKH